MNRKVVHFIRHGQTGANRQHRHQGPHEPLSDLGREQAAAVAKKLADLRIDTLLTSTFTRARETATIISEELNIPYTLHEEVVEFLRPAYIYGRSHYSLASLWYVVRLYLNRANPAWDDDGAENLFHVQQRMQNAMRVIEASSGSGIAVVSHAIFMDMFTQMVCSERDIKLSEFTKGMLLTKKIPNTGLATFSIDMDAPGQTCKWWFHGFGHEAAQEAYAMLS